MATIKCKMCGANIEVDTNVSTAECEYCGSRQTLPKISDDRKAQLYDRANHFRLNNEFDKAEAIYNQILNEDPDDAESYWSLVLCRYGIEYVEDPSTHKRVPTVNRTQFTSVFDDPDYKQAIAHSDSCQMEIYESEAKAIDDIQKGILAISKNEESFDVFICYKETSPDGRRTKDSVRAQEIYQALTKEGFKVFFSRITLESKLGTAYEPYIFAALNSAKVMLAVGTKPEHFNAVWVKNEWSRFLAMSKKGGKTLIPVYEDMDPYDLPSEFGFLQALDMSRIGFVQDLLVGIRKLLSESIHTSDNVASNNTIKPNIALLKRVKLFIEDGEWTEASDYCERALDIDPEDAEAYLLKLMVHFKIKKKKTSAICQTCWMRT